MFVMLFPHLSPDENHFAVLTEFIFEETQIHLGELTPKPHRRAFKPLCPD
jgi:hypothetical protein